MVHRDGKIQIKKIFQAQQIMITDDRKFVGTDLNKIHTRFCIVLHSAKHLSSQSDA